MNPFESFLAEKLEKYISYRQGLGYKEKTLRGYQLKPGQYNLIVSILRLSIIKANAHNGWKGLIP